ncbi:MAG: T9SS type A sorting domain-containing protein [Bacteroidetes bacterium]|nr:T9SS type A sorting domain-containing protein [Bacteroidota bacterium]
MKIPMVALLILCNTGILFSQTETKLSSGIAFDGEPNMMANPNDPRQITVAWMGLGWNGSTTVITIRTRSTSDGGKTWGGIQSIPHFSSDWGSADPTMAYHKSGKLYLAYIDYRQAEDSGGVFLFSSNNNGGSWNYESQIMDVQESTSKLPLDRPWIAVDNSGGNNDGRLFITTKPAPWIPAPNRPYFKISKDGKSWSTFRFLDTVNYLTGNFIQAPMAAPSCTKDGKFIAAYPSYVTSQSVYPKYFLAKSSDGGNTFSYSDLLVNPGSSGDTNLKAGYQLLADPWNANRIAMIRVDNTLGDADIVVNATWNQGINWNSNVRVNDDATANGVLQDLPWASWSKNGELAVCWRDRRNGSGTGFAQNADCYCAVSTDSGKSFGNNLRMSAQSATYNNILTQNGNDFMGCHLNGDTLLAVWGDVRSNKLEIWCSSIRWKSATNTVENLLASENLFQIKIIPNPTSEYLKIMSNYTPDYPLYILDNLGKKIEEISEPIGDKLSIQNLKTGIYYLHGSVNGVTFSEKFEVMR